MKLSVFRGGIKAEAAQVVAGATMRHLRKLVDKSLIQALPTGRYDIHELLRQYAEDKLLQAGEAEGVQRGHSIYFMNLLADLRSEFLSQQTETALTIKKEFDNIRRAWLWAAQHREYEAIDQAADCLLAATDAGNLVWETEELFQRATTALAPEAGAVPHPVWDSLDLVGERLRMELAKERAEKPSIEAILARARQRGDQRQTALSLYLLAQCCQRSRRIRYQSDLRSRGAARVACVG